MTSCQSVAHHNPSFCTRNTLLIPLAFLFTSTCHGQTQCPFLPFRLSFHHLFSYPKVPCAEIAKKLKILRASPIKESKVSSSTPAFPMLHPPSTWGIFFQNSRAMTLLHSSFQFSSNLDLIPSLSSLSSSSTALDPTLGLQLTVHLNHLRKSLKRGYRLLLCPMARADTLYF